MAYIIERRLLPHPQSHLSPRSPLPEHGKPALCPLGWHCVACAVTAPLKLGCLHKLRGRLGYPPAASARLRAPPPRHVWKGCCRWPDALFSADTYSLAWCVLYVRCCHHHMHDAR